MAVFESLFTRLTYIICPSVLGFVWADPTHILAHTHWSHTMNSNIVPGRGSMNTVFKQVFKPPPKFEKSSENVYIFRINAFLVSSSPSSSDSVQRFTPLIRTLEVRRGIIRKLELNYDYDEKGMILNYYSVCW